VATHETGVHVEDAVQPETDDTPSRFGELLRHLRESKWRRGRLTYTRDG